MPNSTEYYRNLDLLGVAQLLNTRLQNVDDAGLATLGGTLSAANSGLVVYNTVDRKVYTWNGSGWDSLQIDVAGDIKFAGLINPTNAATVDRVPGYQYAVDAPGTLVVAGVTFTPSAEVEIGDQVLWVSSTQAYVIQRNDVLATESNSGNVQLATQALVTAGVNATNAVTPARLSGAILANGYTKQKFVTVNVPAGVTGVTVVHGLDLKDPAAFMINTVDAAGNQVELEVDVVDKDSVRLRSLIAITGLRVTVIGASNTWVAA